MVLIRLGQKLDLTDHEREVLENSGYIRWEAVIHWFSVDCVKAGFIIKSGGRWSLTPEGEKVMLLAPDEMVRQARVKYKEWKQQQSHTEPTEREAPTPDEASEDTIIRQVAYEQAVGQARGEIERHVLQLGPYDFQKLVAELLIGMGYYVPFVAPPGPDGGIDIVAYKDPLGTSAPRIRCQVKHRPNNKVAVAEVRALEGVLRKDGDIGLIVSSGGFTTEADREIQVSSKHIERMDLDRLLTLWQNHYDHVRESGKSLLPLVRVFFLAPAEES